MPYKFISHTADIKIRVADSSLPKAFSTSAQALKSIITPKTKIFPKNQKTINLHSQDLKSLLFDFLQEIIFLAEAKDFIISKIKKISLNTKEFKIKAILLGDKFSKYNLTNPVKAITYYQMKIEKQNKNYLIEFVLDI